METPAPQFTPLWKLFLQLFLMVAVPVVVILVVKWLVL